MRLASAPWKSRRPASRPRRLRAAGLAGVLLLAAAAWAASKVRDVFAVRTDAGASASATRRRKAEATELLRLGRYDEAAAILSRLVFAPGAKPDPEADEALAKCYLESFQLRAAA